MLINFKPPFTIMKPSTNNLSVMI